MLWYLPAGTIQYARLLMVCLVYRSSQFGCFYNYIAFVRKMLHAFKIIFKNRYSGGLYVAFFGEKYV